MPKVFIDHREVEIPVGATILEAARRLGVEIPTLCHREGLEPATSCLVCLVKVLGQDKLVPACATRVSEGMQIESETLEVHQVRRMALELLLSDHAGECLAPCQLACPAQLDIPRMLRQISADDFRGALVTVKEAIALPAILGRVCPGPCEKGCRRSAADGAIAICQLKRFVADLDLLSDEPYRPRLSRETERRVAIVGAGPCGLSAAYFLRRCGHAVTIFDAQENPGGRLWSETDAEKLPREILVAETVLVLQLGVEYNGLSPVEDQATLEDLRSDFDAVLLACGAVEAERIERWGLRASARGIQVDRESYATSLPKVFAAGNAIRGKALVVRSVADGREAALAIDRFLGGQPSQGVRKPFSTHLGRLDEDQLGAMVAQASPLARQEPAGAEYAIPEAVEQAGRCLHCDCHAVADCKLRRYAAQYGADPKHYRGPRHRVEPRSEQGLVIYEPGKCIQCGLCVQIATAAGEPLGLSFVGRGFDVRVGVPFGHSWEEALRKVAAECVAACPTGAIALNAELPCPASAETRPSDCG